MVSRLYISKLRLNLGPLMVNLNSSHMIWALRFNQFPVAGTPLTTFSGFA